MNIYRGGEKWKSSQQELNPTIIVAQRVSRYPLLSSIFYIPFYSRISLSPYHFSKGKQKHHNIQKRQPKNFVFIAFSLFELRICHTIACHEYEWHLGKMERRGDNERERERDLNHSLSQSMCVCV